MDYEADIPLDLARSAHAGTSFVPEERAEQDRADYARTLRADFTALSRLADTEEKKAALEEEFSRYREGYARHYRAYLGSRSRCLSTMITGPSRFPTARNQKRNAIADRRLQELLDFRERALKAIRRTLCPELSPIMSGDADAAERLRSKIAQAEADQERMKRVNRAHAKFVKNPESLDQEDLTDQEKAFVRAWKPTYSFDRNPYPPYALSNNSANIRRMKERLEQVERAKATPETVAEGSAARLEDCPAENRVRLFFPGKPDVSIRETLKRNGFRWAPSSGCWQAYRNPNSIETAKRTAGIA